MDLILCIALFSLFASSAARAWLAAAARREMLGAVENRGDVRPRRLAPACSALARLAEKRAPALLRLIPVESVRLRLKGAGMSGLDPAGFALLWISSGVAVSVAAYLLSDSNRAPGALAAGALCFAIVMARLRSLARARREAVERELPFALDLITLSVEAGLDLAQAVSRVSSRTGGIVSRELAEADAAMRMGVRRQDAIRRMADSLAVPSLSALAALLAQSERLGAGVAPVLRAASERLRDERFARAEKRGAIASQKMLLPLVAFIMPATFVIVFGPIFVRAAMGGAEALF
ncbi:MAG: type II secretion system F family protein [Proteobacteria bacterium]|nr:type II secretion system F family protein [Pseudomonadota bacterium]